MANQSSNNIECPKCGHKIDVNDILQHQISEGLKNELTKKEAFYQAQRQDLERQKQTLAEEKQKQDYDFSQRIEVEKENLHSKLKKQLEEEQSAAIRDLQRENAEKSEQLKDFNEVKANIERLKREKDELRDQVTLEKETEFSEKLKAEKLKIQSQMDAVTTLRIEELQNEQSVSFQSLQQELKEKSEQLKDFNEAKVSIERLKREKDELRDTVVLEKEKEFSEKLKDEKLKIQKQVDESSNLKIRELQMQLEQQKQLAEEMRRKAEQGSMQLQGEVQELAIEEWLKTSFPLDTIDEVKKGERGADCLQIVHTRTRQNCGSIYYESKRTKSFQATWIEKFKNDIRDKNAILGVLVTEVMPSDMDRMGLKEGIWICTFEEFKGLCTVLRESVIKLSEVKASQENKGDKMEILYSYLTSNEFKLQIESIVDGFSQMQKDLDSEKRAMAGIWKKREKQLEKVLENTTNMHGAIRGIAGSAIQSVALLELGCGK
jgi:hypothetical protein